ncbi:MAG: hypothetical protein E6L00_04650 [Thaumarchaeota archaeon]|nr:MAG: hypothetical protein E6L00_04650 [Nitrososphaerota archaeon]
MSFAMGTPMCIFQIRPFDKQIYQPGETIRITAVTCAEFTSLGPETVIIADGMADLGPGSTTIGDYEKGKNIIYHESKQVAQNNIVEFNFTIPKSSNTYRYLVLLKPYEPSGTGESFFFTKPDANKIKISDINILTPNVSQEDLLRFGARITDGLGNPLPFFTMDATTNYTGSAFPNYHIENTVNPSWMSGTERQQYFSNAMAWNWLRIPQGKPGTYSLNITAYTASYLGNNGFQTAQVNGLQYNVLASVVASHPEKTKYVVPEFSFTPPILAFGFVLLLAFHRIRLRK